MTMTMLPSPSLHQARKDLPYERNFLYAAEHAGVPIRRWARGERMFPAYPNWQWLEDRPNGKFETVLDNDVWARLFMVFIPQDVFKITLDLLDYQSKYTHAHPVHKSKIQTFATKDEWIARGIQIMTRLPEILVLATL